MNTTDNQEHILVITMRFMEDFPSQNLQAIKYPIANVKNTISKDANIFKYKSDVIENEIDIHLPLAYYWLRSLNIIPQKHLDKKCLEYEQSYFSRYRVIKDDTLLNVIANNEIKYLKQSFLSLMIRYFNFIQKQKFNNPYFLSNIFQLKNKDRSMTNIFFHNHFPDKQSVSCKKRPQFLASLRSDILRIINLKNNSSKKYQFNWLVHDTDILDESYDGFLWYKKASMHPRFGTSYLSDRIPESMKDDNIWCFVHDESIDSYYKNIIQKLPFLIESSKEKRENSLEEELPQSASGIFKLLTLDKAGVRCRLEILEKLDVDIKNIEKEDLEFLFDKIFDENLSIDSYLKDLIVLTEVKKLVFAKKNKKYNMQQLYKWLKLSK